MIAAIALLDKEIDKIERDLASHVTEAEGHERLAKRFRALEQDDRRKSIELRSARNALL